MSGICGIYNKVSVEVFPGTIMKMRNVMLNRDGDETGLYVAPYIGLGSCRRNPIDVSMTGRQPISNEDGTLLLVFDGRIFNVTELMSVLTENGHTITSMTDSEVLIHGYEEWGIDGLLERVNGMFAFAIWDSRCEELILVRDRIGERPLFYMESEGKIFFSSDIKSIYVGYEKELTIDYGAIDHFLSSYCIPQEYSIFKEVRKVFPAHYVRFGKHKEDTNCYWHLNFIKKEIMKENEYIEIINEKLLLAVRRRISNDIPIGAFLSGGIDSSLIVALAANVTDSSIKTFSMGVKEESYNELKYARMVAEKYSTEHHELIIEPNSLNVLPEIIWAYGEPFADASQIPAYCLSMMSGEHVQVVLTGEGGDEVFYGYNSVSSYINRLYRKYLSSVLRENVLPSVAQAMVSVLGQRGIFRKFNTLAESGRGNFIDTFRKSNVFNLKYKEKMYTDAFKRKLASHNIMDIYEKYIGLSGGSDEIDQEHFIRIKTNLPNDFLTKINIATMMNSLEARSPFLDHELIEFAAKIPSSISAKYGRQKYMLKELSKNFIPHEAIYRKKWGFSIPVGYWIRDKFKLILKEILLSEKAMKRGYFAENYVKNLLEEHLSERFDHSHRLWTLLCLELWHLMFIDKSITAKTNLVSSCSR